MPRINRTHQINLPLPERVGNQTPPRPPDASSGSIPSGRRERHSVLSLLTRPFRRTSAPPPAQGGEQPSRSGAPPRIAAPAFQRLSAVPRDRAEGLMPQGEQSRTEAHDRTTGGSPARPSSPSAASRPDATRRASVPDVNGIIAQFRNAGVDLADVHQTLSDVMNGDPVCLDGHTIDILRQHFPNMVTVGISEGNALAVALREALGQFVPSEPPAIGTPPRAQPQSPPRATGGLPRRPPTPSRGAGTSAPTHQRQAHRANRQPSGAWVERLRRSGIDMSRLRSAVDNTLLYAANLPADIRRALNAAGIDTRIEETTSLVDHPLLQLQQEIRRAESARDSTGGATPTRDAQRANRARQAAPSRGLAMPERDPAENNGQFAWRVYNQNPGVSVEDIASAVVRSGGGNQQETIDALKGHIKTYEKTCATFKKLRSISKADAEGMGFKDAAVYNQDGDGAFSKDLATTCLFGEDLSLRNPKQQVIGLAQVASSSRKGYRADVNKSVVFMDMRKLAEYLVSNPKHPMNNMPLTAENIRHFAFKIV
ncbi:hypothetical protein [Ralstonia solanacearum]|uniref:hypothetical protein n=1 Tax=Ralstonia solanacearum TaxID=305 RepID=UPI002E1A8587